MTAVEPHPLEREGGFGVQRATDLSSARTVIWSFEPPKALPQNFQVREGGAMLRRRTAALASRRLPLPLFLERLLTCRREQIPNQGMRALQLLKNRSKIFRNRTLERLASRIDEVRREDYKDSKEDNCIAALEVLVSFQSPMAPPLLESWLQ